MNQLVFWPNKSLRVKTSKISLVDNKLLEEVADLKKILDESLGVGLAATQIGLDRRFLAIKNSETKKTTVYINPEIVSVFGEKVFPIMIDKDGKEDDFLEGCLSFPDYWGTVKRYLKIQVTWREIRGIKLVKREKVMTGLEAVIFQHEYDHLEGIVFVDRIKEDKGKFFKSYKNKMIKWDLDKVIEGNL